MVIRTSGAPHLGLGHLMRSLALGEAFADAGWSVVFYATVPAFLQERFTGVTVLSPAHDEHDLLQDWTDPHWLDCVQSADVVVGDLYALTADWQRSCQQAKPGRLVMVSDPPLGDFQCDLMVLPTVFDLTVVANLPQEIPLLTAPQHALIGKPVRALRQGAKTGQRLLISCGGGNDLGLAARCLRALVADSALASVQGTVVLGLLPAPARDEVLALAAGLPGLEVREQVADMASLCAGHDVAFGTPAGAALERACLGLAQVLVPIVDNQLALGRGLQACGVATVLPLGADEQAIATALRAMLQNPAARQAQAATACRVLDGGGAAAVVYAVSTTFFPSDDGQAPDVS